MCLQKTSEQLTCVESPVICFLSSMDPPESNGIVCTWWMIRTLGGKLDDNVLPTSRHSLSLLPIQTLPLTNTLFEIAQKTIC